MAVIESTNDDHMDINLRTLKRMDSSVKDILGSASQVAAYEYSDNTWKRLDIEGSLFLVSRTSAPFYSIIINNRLSTDNLVEAITPDYEFRLDIQTGSAYLMIHNSALNKISCIWFYEADELLAVHKKIESILATIKAQQSGKKTKTTANEPVENVLAKLGIVTASKSDKNSSSSAGAPANLSFTNSNGQDANSSGNLLEVLFANSAQKQNLTKKSPVKAANISSSARSVKLEDLFNGATSSSSLDQTKSPVKHSKEMVLTPAMLKNPNGSIKLANESVESKTHQSFLSNSNSTPQVSPPLLSSHLMDSMTSKLHKPDAQKQIVLNKEQFKQTLINLLQKDADFVNTIHSAYLDVINRT